MANDKNGTIDNIIGNDDGGRITNVSIEDSIQKSYLDYAMSVIVGRALPDARDGLKPVHRRVLYTMHTMNLYNSHKHVKSAKVVGEAMGNYHPHGDSAIYDTLVRLTQDFTLRYPIVNGQGNFGSIDGDEAAAMRYTEVKMEKIADSIMADLESDTVDFVPNYDESLTEPAVFPTRIPNLLINGSSGIAVGMATNIPPHNLTEVMNALIYIIDNPTYQVSDILKIVKGPDFPTKGKIIGEVNIQRALTTGRGSIKIRGNAYIETSPTGRDTIIIDEIPYQVNKASLIEKIAELDKLKMIVGLSALRDESDKDGIRIVLEIKRGENASIILNQLFSYTQLEISFGVNTVAIINGKPKLFNLVELLEEFLKHREVVVTRRTNFYLKKALDRLHILEGLKLAVNNIDEVISIIRNSKDSEMAAERLVGRFEVTHAQCKAILDMRLARLTGLEIDKILEEESKLRADVAEYNKILGDRNELLNVIKQESLEIIEKYGDERRTEIIAFDSAMTDKDLIPDEDVIFTMSFNGYVKRMPVEFFATQKRGGKGKLSTTSSTANPENEDEIVQIIYGTNHTELFILTNLGRVHFLTLFQIPEASRTARGRHIQNFLQLEQDEKVVSILSTPADLDSKYIVIATKKGLIKRSAFSEYGSRRSGMAAIKLREGDEIVYSVVCSESDSLLMATQLGKSCRADLGDFRPLGRVSQGVTGIKLSPKDSVVALCVIPADGDAKLLTITENGMGKLTPVSEYRTQNRGGSGIKISNVTGKTGNIVGAMIVLGGEHIIISSSSGKVIRFNVEKDIRQTGRTSQGVTVMTVDTDAGEKVNSFAIINDPEEDTELHELNGDSEHNSHNGDEHDVDGKPAFNLDESLNDDDDTNGNDDKNDDK